MVSTGSPDSPDSTAGAGSRWQARYADASYEPMAGLEVSDLACRQAGDGTWLVTYRLRQDGRSSRRLTVWRRDDDRWIALYHQGTVIA